MNKAKKTIKLNDVYISKERSGKHLIVSKDLGKWIVGNKQLVDYLLELEKGNRSIDNMHISDDVINNLYYNGIISIDGKNNFPRCTLHDTIISSNNIPSLCILHVSNYCNLNCKYCYAHDTNTAKNKMSIETMKKAIDRFFELDTPQLKIEFHGGEPLLQYKTIKIGCAYAEELAKQTGKKVEFSMQSNLTFVNNECLDLLKKYKIQIRISLDGPKEINDYYRQDQYGNGSFDLIVNNIKMLNKNGIYPEVVSVVTTKNIDNLIEMTKLFASLNLTNLRFIPYWSQGMGNELDIEEVPQEKMVSKYFELLDWILSYNNGVKKEKQIRLYTLNKEIEALTTCNRSYMCLRCPCGAGMNMVDVSSNGDIYPCEEMNEITEMYVGNIYDGDIIEQYNSSNVIAMLRNRNPEHIEQCSKCQWKRHCQSGCANKNYQKYGKCETISDKCDFYKLYFEELAWFIYEKMELIKNNLLQ